MIRKTTAGEASELAWFKSSYSGGNDGESCVELALTPGTIHIRDSKTVEGPRLSVTPRAWAIFLPYASES
ncbi:DUF397 domain-containing protein [Streptomyces lancefieldiae]|uniref:DUF397 domain-containing protein n=1 Tax=Streptomyces lancefieldiae TaxID=3075520 RepID=A0ABU3AJH6_9ACTN|nr:DUF397 domain-containing protein [Streptomyces sp. DSM 40712]MDT0610139.1 DUF397 domain-containing protein [Streptomyces sp. DSM 40712]